MLPAPVTRIDPPFARTGPVTPVEIVCVDDAQAAQDAPGSVSAAGAASEAPANTLENNAFIGASKV
jgi:hypothetical protein